MDLIKKVLALFVTVFFITMLIKTQASISQAMSNY